MEGMEGKEEIRLSAKRDPSCAVGTEWQLCRAEHIY
jgi:hypothetical protein